jgi:glycosyltransferase involved in cell wall biosynthesis
MRLLILGYELPPLGGGTARALSELLRVWDRDPGLDIEVWTAAPPFGHLPSALSRVRLREFLCKKKQIQYWTRAEQARLLAAMGISTASLKESPDAVLVWGGLPLGPLLFGRIGKIPSVLALRGSDVPGFNPRTSSPFWKMLARRIWSRAGRLTANSPALADLAQETFPGVSITVIPNGVRPVEVEVLGKKKNRKPGCPLRILCVSRLIPRKRVDWLIRALALLTCEGGERVTVDIAGDGPERQNLEKLASDLDVEDRIAFLGEVSPDDMIALYARADAFVLPSQNEGLSNALLEAMSFGLPCCSSAPSGFVDLDAAVSHFSVIQELSALLMQFLANSPTLLAKGEMGRRVAANYRWEAVAGQYKRLLLETAERG